MKTIYTKVYVLMLAAAIVGCQGNKDTARIQREVETINLSRGEIALCGTNQFGQVEFALSCEEKVRADFNLATALLHSFEYTEAEKVFAKVIDQDPQCLMAYWGVAMSNFHPLWTPPNPKELEKGARTIALARSLESPSSRETQYIEAIAAIFDGWENRDHKTRVQKFVTAAEAIYSRYPDDKEAAIFYALALRSSADPADKSFAKQKRAGEILESLFPENPDHPGVAHYLIHNYDYPELADLALPAARKYASIAANSAHAQHMPSHIFTRLGLWDESIQSNINSMEAAKCYAEKMAMKGNWDQELHGMDYLVYAYLQQARDDKAKEQVDYLGTMETFHTPTFTNAYTFAAVPIRYALERKDWKAAASIELHPKSFPWDKFQWQKGIHHFGRLLGNVNTRNLKGADGELAELKRIHAALLSEKKDYEANQVKIQITASEAWISYANGKKEEGLKAMIAAADMEDATEKHAVTPGEVAPARELLGHMYMAMRNYPKAAEAYQANLKKRPGRFNSIYGAALAAKNAGDMTQARQYFQQLTEGAKAGGESRPEVKEAVAFLSSRF